MRLLLLAALHSALLCLASSFQCFQFKGMPDHAKKAQHAVTCDSTQHYCSSSHISYNGDLNGEVLEKGCSTGERCNQTTTDAVKGIDNSVSVLCCDSELCNEDLMPDLGEYHRTECLACQGPPSSCEGSGLPYLRCEAAQTTCIEVSITTAHGHDIHHTMIKSCSNSSSCPGLSAFSNGQEPVTVSSSHRCCTGSLCNSGRFAVEDPGAENGLECHNRSSPAEVSTMRCRGKMNRCADLMGSSSDHVLMSGCATEAFCEGLSPKVPIPGWTSTTCCSESLCNHDSPTDPRKQ
ncbi:urokinase plasminogen activator surface receptor-like isoform X2 [Hyperolius riggenbachi]|uniref:urokinase plasminogen activator surface receptor-like isoform X2 n=1 Tax=Hyperolius riggenbachi TaxID=752182 RepID=UPI0035A28D1F